MEGMDKPKHYLVGSLKVNNGSIRKGRGLERSVRRGIGGKEPRIT